MAVIVTWSPRALDDVDEIAAYIAHDSEAYAASVVRAVLTKARSLSSFPHRGRMVPEFGDANIRELFAYSYRIIYKIEFNTVIIAAVIHGKRTIDLSVKP